MVGSDGPKKTQAQPIYLHVALTETVGLKLKLSPGPSHGLHWFHCGDWRLALTVLDVCTEQTWVGHCRFELGSISQIRPLVCTVTLTFG